MFPDADQEHIRHGGSFSGLLIALLVCAGLSIALQHGLAGALWQGKPRLALMLSPDFPPALATLAIARKTGEDTTDPARAGNPGAPAAPQAGSSAANPQPQSPAEPKMLLPPRDTIRLARQVLQNEPLTAAAVAALALGLEENDPKAGADAARKLMRFSTRISLRNVEARYWLLKDGSLRNDAKTLIGQVDLFFRLGGAPPEALLKILTAIADDPRGRPIMIERLKANPAWRENFLNKYPTQSNSYKNVMQVLQALYDGTEKMRPKDIRYFVIAMIQQNKFDDAYYMWLQTLKKEQLGKLSLLFNGDFDLVPSGLPFDWILTSAKGSTTEIASIDGRKSVLEAIFFGGRTTYAGASQWLMLTPGRYKLSGEYRLFELTNARGLVWRISCNTAISNPIAESEGFRGHTQGWRRFEFTIQVPDTGCPAQLLYLTLPARNGPEKNISGRALFDSLSIVRE